MLSLQAVPATFNYSEQNIRKLLLPEPWHLKELCSCVSFLSSDMKNIVQHRHLLHYINFPQWIAWYLQFRWPFNTGSHWLACPKVWFLHYFCIKLLINLEWSFPHKHHCTCANISISVSSCHTLATSSWVKKPPVRRGTRAAVLQHKCPYSKWSLPIEPHVNLLAFQVLFTHLNQIAQSLNFILTTI